MTRSNGMALGTVQMLTAAAPHVPIRNWIHPIMAEAAPARCPSLAMARATALGVSMPIEVI